jgi:flagellar capping protein FliD
MTQATDTDIREIRDLILGLDKKIDGIDKRLEIFQARTDERFNSIDQRFNSLDQRLGSLEDRTKSQDSRLWTFVTALVLAGLGIIAKLAFFPSA